MRVAVFLPNLIGDAVMATPALRALRLGLPDAQLLGVMRSPVKPVFDGSSWLDQIITYRPKSPNRRDRFWGVVTQLREARVDAAALLPNSIRSALMARLGGCRRIVGFDRGGRTWLLTDRLRPPRDAAGRLLPTPAVESYLAIIGQLGCPPHSTRLELFTTASEEAAADAAWSRLALNDALAVVALNTGGAYGPAKNWPIEHFARLAGRLVTEQNCRVLVLCGPAERENARAIVGLAADERVTSLADEPVSIGLTKACLKRCALLITTDSGPRHLATAFGVPVVTLFGPTHIAWTRTQHPRAIHLQVPVACGPCQRPTCAPGHHRCMKELDPDSVFQAARRLLGPPTTPIARGPHFTAPAVEVTP